MTAEGCDFSTTSMVQDSAFCSPSHGNYLLGIFFHFLLLNSWECITEAFHGGGCYCKAVPNLILPIKKVSFSKRKWAEDCFCAPSNREKPGVEVS
jgi:hypothetical protein